MDRVYPSDVSDAEWALIEPFIIDHGAPRKRGRCETPELARRPLNAMRYLLKTGCQWRMLPKEYPPRTTVHDTFTRWTRKGLWERINTALREGRRVGLKKNAVPSAATIDSQSVKCADTVAPGSSGYDAGKKIKGRKRHILTGTQGLLLGVVVTPASVRDRDAAKVVFCVFCPLLLGLRIIFADGGYAGKLGDFITATALAFGHAAGLALQIIRRSDKAKGFVLLPRRWVVERTFGWLVKARRLVRDHERDARHLEAFVYLAMIGHSVRQLAASK